MSRILTTHAGSLPRPESLATRLAAKSRGEDVDEAGLARDAEDAVRETIARQLDVGLDVVNDGEVARESFFTYVQHRMSGFGGKSQRKAMGDLLRHPEQLERLRRLRGTRERVDLLTAPRAIGDVRYENDAAIEAECARLERLLAAHTGRYASAFMSAPSPGIVAAAMENAHYASLEDYVAALGAALRVEYQTIARHGFVLQIDAPDLALERHTLFQDRPLDEFLAFARLVVRTINDAIAGIDPTRVRLHVCWGNYEGAHDMDVALADIWPVLREARVGGYLLSMANPRHAHEYRLLRELDIPPDTRIVPGVIDTTTSYVEHPETVADRLLRVADAFGDPTRLLAGTDCGFETSAGTVAVVPELVWAKLGALVEGARLASERLFGGASS